MYSQGIFIARHESPWTAAEAFDFLTRVFVLMGDTPKNAAVLAQSHALRATVASLPGIGVAASPPRLRLVR